jgi:hypothetical protein
MTDEEVKTLIQELEDKIPAIFKKLQDELEEETDKKYKKYSKDNK